MIQAIHSRFGAIAGAGVGLALNLVASHACCGTPPLTLGGQMLNGIVVAAVTMALAVTFTSLVSHRPFWALATIGLLITLWVGASLGPIAYMLPHPMIAMFVCAVLGALLAFLLARQLCPRCPPTLAGDLQS